MNHGTISARVLRAHAPVVFLDVMSTVIRRMQVLINHLMNTILLPSSLVMFLVYSAQALLARA